MPSSAPHPDLILFGGAFDPPHKGHRQCLEHAAEAFPNAEIWMMPGVIPAGAAGNHKTPKAPYKHRFAMCELLAETLPTVQVSDLEGKLRQPNYTYLTLEYLQEQCPDRTLGILIGQDQLRSFPDWREPNRILELASLIVVRRIGSQDGKASMLLDVETALGALMLDWKSDGDLIRILNNSRPITLLDVELCNAESAIIRKLLSSNRTVPCEWLPIEVLDYINTGGLYRPGGIK